MSSDNDWRTADTTWHIEKNKGWAASPAEHEQIAICFDHVTKTYKLYKNDRSRFLGLFRHNNKQLVGTINANDDLSFTVKKGEAVALVGHNGAGKSTALKMVCGVCFPTRGTVTVNGRVSAMLELNAGFDGQLTGRENLRLRSQALGLTKQEFAGIEEDIVEFAELGLYIDQPMRTYSSGMKARLGFAFAACLDPDILIADEVLSVGDKNFKKKCIDRMREIMTTEGVTVLFVTHDSASAQEFCTRGIVLDEGRKLFEGPIAEAIAYYDENL